MYEDTLNFGWKCRLAIGWLWRGKYWLEVSNYNRISRLLLCQRRKGSLDNVIVEIVMEGPSGSTVATLEDLPLQSPVQSPIDL